MNTDEMAFRAKMISSAIEDAANSLRLAVELSRRRPDHPPHLACIDAAILQKLGRTMQTLAVKACNYGLTDADEARREKLVTQAGIVASWYGLTATGHGDPRGAALRIHSPVDDTTWPSNTWGGKESGYGVA